MKMNYDDIINLPHHVSKKRKPMSMMNRAAQFAPFAALVGYEDAINETANASEEELGISTALSRSENQET